MSPPDRFSEGRKAALPIPHLIVLATIALAVAIRYVSVFNGTSIIAEPMYRREIEPLIVFFQASVKAGSLPLWNPYCYLGMPQLPGHFPGVFYPLNFLLLFHHNAGAIFLAVHQLIGAASVYIFGVYLRKNMMARLVAVVFYLLLHECLVGEFNLVLAAALSWLPLGMIGVAKCLLPAHDGKPHVASLMVINSLALGLMLLAGSLGLSAMLVGASLTSFLYLKLSNGEGPRLAPLIAYLLSIGISMSLSAPVLMPLVEWMGRQPADRITRSQLPAPSLSMIAGPAIMPRSDFEKTRVKPNSIMQNLWSLMGHYGRYLCVFDEPKQTFGKEFYEITPNANLLDLVPSSAGFLGNPTPSYTAIAARARLGDLRDGYAALPKDPEQSNDLVRFCEITGTKFLIAPGLNLPGRVASRVTDCKSLLPVLQRVPELHFLQLYGALPDAYAIQSWKWMASEKELLDQLFASPDQVDLFRTVLIDKIANIEIDEERLDKMPFNRVDPPKGPPLEDSPAGASVLKPVDKLVESPEHIALSANVDKPSFVVLNGASYPGWKSYVDGAPVPIYRANGIARAVFVLAGPHLIEFDYRPDSVKTGCSLAIAALVVEVLLLFWWLLGLMRKTVHWLSYGVFE